jgi:hypothetical protein
MTALLSVPVTAAVTAQLGPVLQIRRATGMPVNAGLQANFTYGSGGTSADAWVQTSFDEGLTWCDVANFHFTTSSGRVLFNLSSLTPVTTQATPTDGTLAANTAKDGFVGSHWRVKYTTVGTYAGNTALRVDMISTGLTAQ